MDSTWGILVTPNVGAFNDSIVSASGGTCDPGAFIGGTSAGSMILWQNNPAGFLIMGPGVISNGKTAEELLSKTAQAR